MTREALLHRSIVERGDPWSGNGQIVWASSVNAATTRSAGDGHAVRQLAELLREQGDVDEAVAVLRRRADAGDGYAVQRLVDLQYEQGSLDNPPRP